MAEAVKVIVRCRPLNTREKNLNCKVVVKMQEDRGICTISKPGQNDGPPKQFTFDGAYYMNSTTEQIYNDIAYPLVEGVVQGYNGTVFAYGQTGCGKSFSMQGIDEPATQRGIIPRAFQHIFESVSVAENTKYLVHASYLEIYNEEVRDLLSKNIKESLEVKENPDKGIYVKGLSKKPVGNVSECEKIMSQGWKNRATGATLMNADSSRSHSIFTIYLEACDTGIDGGDHIRAGKLNLVDLAGSERQGKTGATGERLREATKINLSLSALGNVISALVDGKAKHIPYRDSKLTRLLQDSLGGNTKTLMVSCLSPADNNYEETLSTLRYANRAKNIKNKPTINEDPKDALLREYQEEIKKLRALLAGQLGADGIKGSPAPADDDALLEGQSPSQVRLRTAAAAVVSSGTTTHTDDATLRVGVGTSTSNTDIGLKAAAAAEKAAADARKEKDEAIRLKQEYEGKLMEMKEQYEAEQISNAKLQEDIAKLKTQYEEHIAQEGLANQKNLTMERLTQEEGKEGGGGGGAEIKEITDVADIGSIFIEGLKKATETSKPELAKTSTTAAAVTQEEEIQRQISGDQASVELSIIKQQIPTPQQEVVVAVAAPVDTTIEASTTPTKDQGDKPTTTTTTTTTNDQSDLVRQHEEALRRLQLLQQNMIGGENARDEELKKKRKSREQHVDRRIRQLAEATKRDEDDVIFDVYENMNDEVKARDRVIGKHKKRNEALKMEISDLNYEFERDRSEYLETIRKQERDISLLAEILNKIQPTVRRDCNYSNIDHIKKEAQFDEDLNKWSLPDITVTRTKLPTTNEKGFAGLAKLNSSEKLTPVASSTSSSPENSSYPQQRNDEDRYLMKLKNRDERLASNYFQPKRQLNQIIASAHSDPGRSGASAGSRYFPAPQPSLSNHSTKNDQTTVPRYQDEATPQLNNNADNIGLIEYQRRPPHKLEALSTFTKSSRKKKKSHTNLFY